MSSAGTLNHFISDHQPIYLVHKKNKDTRKSVEFKGRSYKHFDKDKFRNELLATDWNEFYNLTDPGEAWNAILDTINPILDSMCPLRSFRIKNYRPEWMTDELIEQIKDRDYFYKKAKSKGNQDDWNIARHLRNTTNTNIRGAKKDFILTQLRNNSSDAKKFWKTIHEVIPSGKGAVSRDILLKDGNTNVDRADVAHFINDFFINVGKINKNDLDVVDPLPSQPLVVEEHSVPTKYFTKVLEREVFAAVKEINVSKSSGVEGISSYVIKEVFGMIIPEIAFMFNLSLTAARFPDQWKKALVIPIPKTGNLSDVQNYRPISLLPLPGKVLEKLVHQQISNHLETNSLLANSQHGFRKDHSTLHSIAQLTKYINAKLDSKLPTLVAYIDIKKAFDCVQHDVLLSKLANLNLDQTVISWIGSYLSNRKQRVLANGVHSSYLDVTQGVPQGSVLGPLFYIVYANDLSTILKKCNIALYADDTVLFTANATFADSVSKLQSDMNSLSVWCKSNGVSVNVSKTKVMTFGSPKTLKELPQYQVSYGGLPLQTVSSYKYLGLTMDSQLNFNLHVNRIFSSVSGKLKQFQRMRGFLNVDAALLVYKCMLLPILEYGDIFLSAASQVNRKKLQTLQNKGLRCALGIGADYSSNDLHAEAGLLKLKYRRDEHILNFMYDWSWDPDHAKAVSTMSMATHSKSKRTLKVKRPRTEKYKKSLAYNGPKKWNALPQEFHDVSFKPAFKVMTRRRVNQNSLISQDTCVTTASRTQRRSRLSQGATAAARGILNQHKRPLVHKRKQLQKRLSTNLSVTCQRRTRRE